MTGGNRTRWLCCECWTEGDGHQPKAFPRCGCTHCWFITTTASDDERTMKEIFDDFAAGLFLPSSRENP